MSIRVLLYSCQVRETYTPHFDRIHFIPEKISTDRIQCEIRSARLKNGMQERGHGRDYIEKKAFAL